MIQYSDVTGKTFRTEDAVFYRNMRQSAWLLGKSDCIVLDVFSDGNEQIVFCFPKSLHNKYINEWRNRPHEEVEPKEWKIRKMEAEARRKEKEIGR